MSAGIFDATRRIGVAGWDDPRYLGIDHCGERGLDSDLACFRPPSHDPRQHIASLRLVVASWRR